LGFEFWVLSLGFGATRRRELTTQNSKPKTQNPKLDSRVKVLSKSQTITVRLGAMLVALLCRTYRYHVEDRSGFLGSEYPLEPVVMLMWHNRILSMPTIFKRCYPKKRRKGLLVLTSTSRDGAILGEFVKSFGIGAVRGSSSRRGLVAFLDLARKLNDGFDVCISPDGPRGPKYVLGPGAVLLSQRCNAPLLPFTVEYHSCWRLKSWDAFAIPKPFSRIDVTLETVLRVNKTQTDEEFELERQRIEKILLEQTILR
jgi:lysophospholipid acyltransferase (LPLAT)-like uncharacterized protein